MRLPPIKVGAGPYTPKPSEMTDQRKAERYGHTFNGTWYKGYDGNKCIKCSTCNGMLIITFDGQVRGSVVESNLICPNDYKPQ